MYGKLHKIVGSKMVLWSATAFAIAFFCLTAAIAFGMTAHRNAQTPGKKITSNQPAFSTLPVQNSDTANTQSALLQGQQDNGSVSQPAAAANTSNAPELSAGIAATSIQNGASASASTSLQSGGGSVNTDMQAQVNAAGLNMGAQANLP